ncbi:MAG: hypothetical protein ACKOSQ_09850 [Planctomycetaceae bacterium]
MLPRTTFTTALARLVSGSSDPRLARCYRPLVAGPALLRRPPGAPTWTVALESDSLLRPRTPRRAEDLERLAAGLVRRGIACRLGAAVAGPLDVTALDVRGTGDHRAGRLPRRLRLDIYGWALMYQPPGLRGRAVVDADERFEGLPAVFELPLELLDRADFLESRGVRTRPLVIPTRPEDFAAGPDGRPRNRFFPDASLRPPRSLDLLP